MSYIRVSTDKQGRSDLGLEAQRQAIARFAGAESFEIVAEYVEVETGKGADALDRSSRGARTRCGPLHLWCCRLGRPRR